MEQPAIIEKEIVSYCMEKNMLVSSHAVKLLSEHQDYKKLVDEFALENEFVLTEQNVKDKIIKKNSGMAVIQQVIVKNVSFKPIASQLEKNFHILSNQTDIEKRFSGKVNDFLDMFKNKFDFLSSILKARPNLEIKPISRLSKTTKNNEITVCGMVFKKWVSKNGHPVVQLEDTESSCICLFLKNDRQALELSKQIMLDDVIAVKGKKISDDLLIVSEVHWPDLPIKPVKKSQMDLDLIAVSDIHVGSRLFLEKNFTEFLNWLKGNTGSQKEQLEIEKIKYMVICGDNVDGIGVYPDQFDELAIRDIFEQYEAFSELIKQVPEHIEVFIIPGQHDAVRRADPQPPIPKQFVKEIADYKNIHFLGSPSWIEIEGLKILLYHGASLHDIFASIPGLDYHKPAQTMSILLKRRDTMAPYGQNQPYVPEKNDSMLIREEPDIYFGGDIHHNGYLQYRACSIINAGTWQARTGFQIQQGFVPTPATAVQVSLATRKINEKKF